MMTIEETLDIPLPPPSSENYVRILSIKKDAAVSGINAALKADENQFRRRENDTIQKLFEKIQREYTMKTITGNGVPV